MNENTREQLITLLKSGQTEVTFIKVNGETRTMLCTLDPSLHPPRVGKLVATDTPKKEKKVSLETIVVWCLDKEQWRSFRVDSVISVRALDADQVINLAPIVLE